MPKPRTLIRSLPWLMLLAASASELAIVLFARLATGHALPSQGTQALILAGLLATNAIVTTVLRRSRLRRIRWLRPTYQMGNLAAIVAGVGLGSLLTLHAIFLPDAPTFSTTVSIAGAGSIALAVGVVLYGTLVGQHRTKIEEVRVGIPHLPAQVAPLRIAHITDLHIGPLLRAPKLRELVARVNETEPDLIAITGDIFDFDPRYIEEGCHELAKLVAPLGTFAVIGNHDIYTGAEAVTAGIEQLTPIALLRDSVARIELEDGAPLYVLGIDDPGRGLVDRDLVSPALESLVARVPEGAPHLLLMHRPSYLPQVARLGIPLALAGHTHGGQITLPWPAHQHNVARLMTRFTRGLFEAGTTQMYVSRGLGVGGLPIRLNCPREITILHVERRA